MPARLTLSDFISRASEIHAGKYSYADAVYKNQKTPVAISCPDHGAFFQTPADHIHARAGCPVCAGNKSLSIEQTIRVFNDIHASKYTYPNLTDCSNLAVISIVCPEHGEFTQTVKSHKTGRGCPACGGTSKLSQAQFIAKCIATHGSKYDYSNTTYVNANTPVAIGCPNHGVFYQRAAVHTNGAECPKCAKESAGAKLRKSPVIPQDTRFKHISLGEYKNNKSRITVTCTKGHVFTRVYNDHLRGFGCPTCVGRVSAEQEELADFIASLGMRVITNSTSLIPPKELDIVLPEHKLVIEYNGTYWHSSAFPNYQTRHKLKSDLCAAKGYRVIHIWSDIYLKNKEVVHSMLRAQLGLLPKAHARKCELRELSQAEARDFLTAYHLQGYVAATYYGLIYGGAVVSCMGFRSTASIRGTSKGSGVMELCRYASSHSVVGGAARLLAAFTATHTFTQLVTYCDLSMFTGDLYTRLGFTHVSTSAPDYTIYNVNNKSRLHKASVQKRKLKQLLGGAYDDDLTEFELTQANRLYRVYDCGKAKYVLYPASHGV